MMSYYDFAEFEGLPQLNGLQYNGEKGLNALKQPIFDLLEKLKKLPANASTDDKVQLFHTCMVQLNALNSEWDGDLLSTDEREEILPLLDAVAERVEVRPYNDDYKGEWLEEWLEF